MKTFSRIFILIVIVISGVYIGYQLFFYSFWPQPIVQPQLNTEQVSQEIKVSLIINFSDSDIKNFTDVSIENNGTVFDLLKKVTAENNINLKYKDYGGEMGIFIESIGENVNDLKGNKFWQFWVNSEYAKVGPGSSKLKNGDVVEWKFTTGQF